MGAPVIYQIQVRGHVDREWSEWFDGLAIDNQPNGEATLSGPVVDQAALHGLLNRVFTLKLTLIAVNRVEPGP